MSIDQYIAPKFEFDLPIIWVDTNVIIEMARAIHEEEGDAQARERGNQLHDRLRSLTHDGKIIYLEAEQRREYGMNPRLFEECERLQSRLSQGIMVHHSSMVAQYQMHRMMRVFCGIGDAFVLKMDDIFYSDPIHELERTRQSGFIISARFPISQEERDQERALRDKITSDWEELRKSKIAEGITYEEQLDLEYQSHSGLIKQKLRELLQKKLQGLEPSVEDLLNAQPFFEPLYWWENATGQKFDLAGLLDFMDSEVYRAIPVIEIQCKLLAYLTTTQDPVSRGDRGDVDQLSVVLPYCDVLITDRAMKHRLEQVLGLAQKYHTQVFSLRNFSDIIKYLDQFD